MEDLHLVYRIENPDNDGSLFMLQVLSGNRFFKDPIPIYVPRYHSVYFMKLGEGCIVQLKDRPEDMKAINFVSEEKMKCIFETQSKYKELALKKGKQA